jgi:AraC-like DNA-binding protein
MDALSEALSAVHMTGAIFLDAEFTAPWGVSVPAAERLASVLAPTAEHIVNFHLVIEGEMLAQDESGATTCLSTGDILIMPYGDSHRLSNGATARFVNSALVLRRFSRGEILKLRLGGGGARTHIICGFFGCRRQAVRLFLAGLPSILRIPLRGDPSGAWIESSIRHLLTSEEKGRPGRSALLSRMAEALFIESMRRYMESLSGEQAGWLAAARDPVVGPVLTLIHREPGRKWSTTELAHAVGSSRSVVAERFGRLLGEAPITYLSRWRLHLASRLLETTQEPVAKLAYEVGYDSEASFNRAFKREFGMPPVRFRRQSQQKVGVW